MERRDDYWAKDHPLKRYKYNFDKIKISAIKRNDALIYEKFKKVNRISIRLEKQEDGLKKPILMPEKGWVKT